MKKNVVLRMLLLAASLVLVLAACQQPGAGTDPFTGLAVTPAEVTLDVGATQQLAAVFEYESGKTVEADVSWKSSDSGVATVAEDGLVTAVAEGTATVTATSTANATHTASSSITVTAEEEPGDGRVVLSSGSMNLVRTQTVGIEADVEVEGDATGGVTWSSSAPSVVEVSPTGDAQAMLKAVGVGSSTITATSTADSDAYASITVNVEALTVTIDLDWADHAEGHVGTVTGVIGGSFAGADSGLTWEVFGDVGAIDIDDSASVSGQVKAFTSTGTGSVTIRATSVQDDAVSDSVVVDLLGPVVVDPANLYVGDWLVTGPAETTYDLGTVFNPYPFDDIDAAITALNPNGTIWVASGSYFRDSSLGISKPLTLRGAGESETTIGLSGHGSYGINVTASSVVIQDLTVIGPRTGGTLSQQFGVRVHDVENFSISDVTIRGSGRSELDLNAVNGATLTRVTLDGAGSEGVGLALTDTTDVAAEGLETMGNDWGGVGIWPTDGGTVRGVSIDAFSNLAEEVPVYVQIKDGRGSVEQLELEGYEFAVRNTAYDATRTQSGVESAFTFYFQDADDAAEYAVDLNEITEPANDASTIQLVDPIDGAILLNEFLVFEDMNIQRAVTVANPDAIVNVYGEHEVTVPISLNKPLRLVGHPDNLIVYRGKTTALHMMTVGASDVTITGLNFEATDMATDGLVMLHVRAHANVEVSDNSFTGTFEYKDSGELQQYGLYIYPTRDPQGQRISGNILSDVSHVYITVHGTDPEPVNLEIQNNTLVRTKGWIIDSSVEGVTLDGNVFAEHDPSRYMISYTGNPPASYGTEAALKTVSENNDDAVVRFNGPEGWLYYPEELP